jgi:MFS family permease
MRVAPRTWPAQLVARPWLLAFVPVNAATAGFSVVLPLLILIPLHGSWENVAVAATLYNAAVILSSILWGYLADALPYRRTFLVLNYAGFALLYTVLAGVHSFDELYAIYAVIGVLSPAGASASNLLILEKFNEGERATAYASFQEMTMLGSVAGLLVGYFWTLADRGLVALLLVLAVLSLASAVAIRLWISEASRTLPAAAVASHPEGLVSRLRPVWGYHGSFPFFPHGLRPGPDPFGRLLRWAREELHHELPLILLAGFLFNLSSNLFNISYTPYLYSAGLAATSIFLVNLANNAAQTVLFPLTGPFSQRIGADRLVRRATYLRSVGYLATAGFGFAALVHARAFDANTAVYAVLGGAMALYTTASGLMLFRGVAGRDAGSLLGINSALGGAAAVAGAALAGVLAVLRSFSIVFFLSGGLLLASLPLWSAATLAYERRHAGTPSRTPGRTDAATPSAGPAAPP